MTEQWNVHRKGREGAQRFSWQGVAQKHANNARIRLSRCCPECESFRSPLAGRGEGGSLRYSLGGPLRPWR